MERLQKRLYQNYHVPDLQTTANDVRRAERLDFLPEMQSWVSTECDNSSETEYKTWGFGWVHCLKNDENAQKFVDKLNKQQIEFGKNIGIS